MFHQLLGNPRDVIFGDRKARVKRPKAFGIVFLESTFGFANLHHLPRCVVVEMSPTFSAASFADGGQIFSDNFFVCFIHKALWAHPSRVIGICEIIFSSL